MGFKISLSVAAAAAAPITRVRPPRAAIAMCVGMIGEKPLMIWASCCQLKGWEGGFLFTSASNGTLCGQRSSLSYKALAVLLQCIFMIKLAGYMSNFLMISSRAMMKCIFNLQLSKDPSKMAEQACAAS